MLSFRCETHKNLNKEEKTAIVEKNEGFVIFIQDEISFKNDNKDANVAILILIISLVILHYLRNYAMT